MGDGRQNSPPYQDIFAAAHREWRILLQNEMGDPYGVEQNTTANTDDGYIHQDTVYDIANLSTATASDREAITQLMSTITRLTAELATMNKKIVVSLQEKYASRRSRGGRKQSAC